MPTKTVRQMITASAESIYDISNVASICIKKEPQVNIFLTCRNSIVKFCQ